jgi:hypothetical protein
MTKDGHRSPVVSRVLKSCSWAQSLATTDENVAQDSILCYAPTMYFSRIFTNDTKIHEDFFFVFLRDLRGQTDFRRGFFNGVL